MKISSSTPPLENERTVAPRRAGAQSAPEPAKAESATKPLEERLRERLEDGPAPPKPKNILEELRGERLDLDGPPPQVQFKGGFAASQQRFLALTARKSDLELQGQFINQARLQLARITGTLFNISANLAPDSPQAIQLQSRIAALQSLDKQLELQLRQVDTQRDAVQTEIDAVRKVIDKNIASTFKTFG